MENSSNNEEIGTLIRKKFAGFSGVGAVCLLFKDFLLNFKSLQQNETLEVLNLKTLEMTYLPFEFLEKGFVVDSLLNWKENKFILLGGRLEDPIQAKLFSLEEKEYGFEFTLIKEISVCSESCYYLEDAQIYQDDLFVSLEYDSAEEQQEYRRRVLINLTTFELKILHDRTFTEGEGERFAVQVWHNNKLFIYGCPNYGDKDSSQVVYSFDNNKFKKQETPKDPDFSRDALSFVLNDIVYFVDESRFWTCLPHSNLFKEENVFGSQLPWKRLRLSQYENKVVFWESKREVKKVFLLTIGEFDAESFGSKADLVQLPPNRLITHIQNSQEKAVHTDVTFVVQNYRFPANKHILASCEFFKNMFESSMKEGTMQEIAIEDMSPICFKAILDSIYLREISLNEELASELIVQANKLLLCELKESCEMYLAKEIREDNFVELVQIAKTADAYILRKHLQFFLNANINILKKIDPDDLPNSMLIEALGQPQKKLKLI